MPDAKMNPIAKLKWLHALRSCEYEQTADTLQDSQGFCCLGVICAVAEKEEIRVLRRANDRIRGHGLDDQVSVKSWAQISKREEATVMTMNDEKGFSFKEIADYIEENL